MIKGEGIRGPQAQAHWTKPSRLRFRPLDYGKTAQRISHSCLGMDRDRICKHNSCVTLAVTTISMASCYSGSQDQQPKTWVFSIKETKIVQQRPPYRFFIFKGWRWITQSPQTSFPWISESSRDYLSVIPLSYVSNITKVTPYKKTRFAQKFEMLKGEQYVQRLGNPNT